MINFNPFAVQFQVASSIHAVCGEGGKLIGGELWRYVTAACPECGKTDARIDATADDGCTLACCGCGHSWKAPK